MTSCITRLPQLATLLSALISVGSVADESHHAHWAYSGVEDPTHWGDLDPAYSACSRGHAQSPIDIAQAQPADLPPLRLDYAATPLNIIDNGHTIQVNVQPGSTLTVGDKTYKLKQFHFHHPSEEHVNGKTFPLEAHLVHEDAAGHLAVLAILYEEGEANSLVETLWHNVPTEKAKAHEVRSLSLQVLDLLPASHGYFTYMGSLTTPPCTEGVTWYVLKSHGSVSAPQIATFAKLYPADARPVQPIGERKILQSQ